MSPEQKADIIHEAARSAPAVVVTVASGFMGFSLHDWMLIATIVYIVLQAGWLLWKWRRAARNKNWMPD